MSPSRSATNADRLLHERQVWTSPALRIAGVDEAGRGPLAGPVVAAAVVLPKAWLMSGIPAHLSQLNDSKQLSASVREKLFRELTALPELQFAIATLDAAQIDALNILRATHRAMLTALNQLSPAPDHVLIDGLRVPNLPWPQTPIVQGDARSYTIAAASILAKVTRDRLMLEYDRCHPGYGFAQHKGYGTPAHLEALRKLGPCPIHRRTFAPIKPAQGELFG